MSTTLLRHAAMVCNQARRGLPDRFANGTPIPMPDGETRKVFALRAARYTAAANRIEGRARAHVEAGSVRVPRHLPAAAPTTGTLTALEMHPRFGRRRPLPKTAADEMSGARPGRIRSTGAAT